MLIPGVRGVSRKGFLSVTGVRGAINFSKNVLLLFTGVRGVSIKDVLLDPGLRVALNLSILGLLLADIGSYVNKKMHATFLTTHKLRYFEFKVQLVHTIA